MILKEDNQQDSTVFQRFGTLNDDGSVTFSVEQGVAGIGAISKHCFGMLADEPLFLSRQGIQAITSNNILAERTIRNRSFFVDSYLTKETNLQNAVACEWNGFYVLCINGVAYVLDGKNKSYKERSIASYDYNYECYYWTNIPVIMEWGKSKLVLNDILYEHEYNARDFSKYAHTVKWNEDNTVCRYDSSGKGYYSQASRCRKPTVKSNTLTASGNDKNNIWLENYKLRTLHPIEAERLQTLPDNYTSCLSSKVKRSEVCGNGWTVDVIAHIFKGLLTN
jgi:site-specific DNA-cytosine methylase